MNKKTKIAILGGVVVLLAVLLYFFGKSKEQERDNSFVSDSWEKTYNPADRNPYGTYVLKELLDTVGLFGNFIELQEDIMESLEDDPKINDIYFFVGPKNHLPDSSAKHLLEFVQKGNTAFISAHELSEELVYGLFSNTRELMTLDVNYDSVQYLKFTHPDLTAKRYKFKHIDNNKAEAINWFYFDSSNFDIAMAPVPVVLGANTADRWNYVKVKYGEGYLFLHSTPYCFTNLCILKRDGFSYVERILEHIPTGRVQWDKYNLKPHNRAYYNGSNDLDVESRRSLLEFIMAHPSLTWALVILISGAFLYAFFKGKRMQRVIPTAELKENTSLKYINTLSSLYMQQGSHSKLISLKEKTFLNFIAERYFIVAKKADENFIQKVAAKAQVEKEKIAEVFSLFDQLNGAVEVTDENLILLQKKIEYF